MKNSISQFAISLVIAAVNGCALQTDHTTKESAQAVRLDADESDPANSQPRPRAFGGPYEILEYERYEEAADDAIPSLSDRNSTYSDGRIRVSFQAAPFGVRLKITNQLHNPLFLDGPACALIDWKNESHAAELRSTTTLFPNSQPEAQFLPIPPLATLRIALDVVMPVYRSRIIETAKCPRERGSFLVCNASLPVYSSGYYIYPGSEDLIESVKAKSIYKSFEVYFQLKSRAAVYGYKFKLSPIRLSTSPNFDDASFEDPNPREFAQ